MQKKGRLAGAGAASWLERFSLPATVSALDAAVLRRVQRGRPSGTASDSSRADLLFFILLVVFANDKFQRRALEAETLAQTIFDEAQVREV